MTIVRPDRLDIYYLMTCLTFQHYTGLGIALFQLISLNVAVFFLTLLLDEDLSIRIGFPRYLIVVAQTRYVQQLLGLKIEPKVICSRAGNVS